MSIGEPRGKKSDDNPRGYSKSQNKLLNALVMIHNKSTNDNNNIRNNENNINGPFDSWGNPSSAPYQNGNTTASFTMAAFSGDGSSLQALVPEYLIKGEMTTLVGLFVTVIVSKA